MKNNVEDQLRSRRAFQCRSLIDCAFRVDLKINYPKRHDPLQKLMTLQSELILLYHPKQTLLVRNERKNLNPLKLK